MEGTATHMLYPRASQGSSRNQGSNSLSSIISTLVPTALIALIAVSAFLIFRTRYNRVYRPRSDNRLLERAWTTPESKTGFFGLIRNFSSLPDSYVLGHNSLDGYLWLRMFKVFIVMSLVGCVITWPVLFPVNATGHGGQQQLDMLSMSNVADPKRFYAHAIIAWIYLGFIVLLIARERLFFIGLRRAYFLSAAHAQRLSSRTILVMGLPANYMEEKALRQMFGSSVRRIWLATDCKKLEDDVKDRKKTALKLEGGEMKLIQQANKNRLKAEKKNKSSDSNESAGMDPKRWIDEKKRPKHRLMPQLWKKVDTINWSRGKLQELNRFVGEQQNEHLDLNRSKVPAAFIEFSNQTAAHEAFQSVGRESKTKFAPRYIGVQPSEVVWKNLGTTVASRKVKIIIATIIIWVLIIFWAIPVAFVGALSNINYLTNKLPWLSFINSIPKVILGVVTGLLPVILLAVLMALVPIFCGLLAKYAGEPTQSAIQLKVQSWYFAFQVVQVFLITTVTSSASAVTTQILQNPGSAPGLLATNLPKASNFYISYFILFGLMQAALQLLNIVPLLFYLVLGKLLDKTPRKKYNRYINLPGIGWGSTYPKFTLLGVIAITYSCIAPLILGFATIGFCLLYVMFRYNWLFVLGNKFDMKGEAYSRALKQLMTGVYLATICLIGLFAIGCSKSAAAAGPLAIMVVFLIVVIIFQFMFDRAIAPLEQHMPLELLNNNKYSTTIMEQHLDEEHLKHENSETGAGASRGLSTSPTEIGTTKAEEVGDQSEPKSRQKTPPFNFLSRRIEPIALKFYEQSKKYVPDSADTEEWIPGYTSEEYEQSYLNPSITDQPPVIWLAKDRSGISKMLVAENRDAGIQSTDAHAELDEKSKLVWHEEQVKEAPLWRRIVRY
ncbi:phosphate metabolism protein 7 [Cladophialophora chaetospira]|uniref:Phosphate metabolism protein 7 n=1 Tax=Cladophialophora chaetospira TaxID=386627 RepID=A0AA38XBQ0_9EURO|nr:phosphate metabolism protein 7 [Cladophialophora chaetospira]